MTHNGESANLKHYQARIVPFHPHLPVGTDVDFPEAWEPVAIAENQAKCDGIAGDSTAEVPVQKAKAEIQRRERRAY